MKKILLMLVAVGTWVYSGAQNAKLQTQNVAKPVHISKLVHHTNSTEKAVTPPQSFYGQSTDQKSTERRKGGLSTQATGTKVGGSYNVNSIRTAPTTQVTYNAPLGTIFYTHREDFTKSFGSGAYELSYSQDGGNTWDSSFIVYGNQVTRYPNGLVYNPVGNTNLKHAYWAYTGPWLSQATTPDKFDNSDSIAFGSARLDSTNIVEGYISPFHPGVTMQLGTEYMSIGDDSVVHCIGNGISVTGGSSNAYESYLGATLNTGTFNTVTKQYDWTRKLFRPHLMPNDNISFTPYDTLGQYLYEPGTAWSQDGKVGYLVIFGNLDSTDAISGKNLNFVSYQPIVYITQNSGANWTMMTPHDFTNDPVLTANMVHTQDSVNLKKPIWRLFSSIQDDEHDFDMVVDAHNALHIFGVVQGSTIGTPDSSGFIGYYTHYGWVCDVSTTTTGTWTSRVIDTVNDPTVIVNIANEWKSSTASSVSFGARVQASRTLDGKKIFVTWVNDVQSGMDSIIYPDVFGEGFDVMTGDTTMVKQFTSSADNFFLQVSDNPIISGTTYTLPCVKVETPAAPGVDGSTAVEYVYEGDVIYADTMFHPPVGIQQLTGNKFSVSPNYPNPFSKVTNFNLNMVEEGTVNVEVFNMVGQKVWSMTPKKMGSGSHVMTIDANGFESGVYFYRVTVNSSSTTQKMIVE
jgi:hypothetical protein